MQYADIRSTLERQGYCLNNEDYTKLVEYTKRKAASAGKDESYIPLLLPDVIKEHYFRITINTLSAHRADEQYIAN